MTRDSLRRSALGAVALGVLVLPACTDWAGHDLDTAAGKVPQLATMRGSVIPDPYEMPRLPAPGSVPSHSPVGDVPAPFTQAQLDSVAPTLTNPLQATPAVLARGERMYAANCTVCHGAQGAGDGPVVQQARGADGKSYGRFPFAPTLVAGAAVSRSDGYLYAVIAEGRNFMPPYGDRMGHEDRWALVHYMRRLQGARGASAAAATPAAPAATPAPGTAAPAPTTATPETGAAGPRTR